MEEALNKYYDHFGENYPLAFGDCKTEAEVIARIAYCIEHNTKEAEPEYEDECDY
jgi:FAD/FMN-containing dehydrogenase